MIKATLRKLHLVMIIFGHVGHGGHHGVLISKAVDAVTLTVVNAVLSAPVEIVCAEVGDPLKHLSVLQLLDGVVAVSHVGVVQGHRATHGLGVVSSAARGAGIDPQPGIALKKRVPITVVALDVQVFKDTVAPGLAVLLPVRNGREIEVLTVNINAVFLDQSVNLVDQPVAGHGICQIEQRIVLQESVFTLIEQQKLGMLAPKGGVAVYALGLKPQKQLHAVLMQMVGNGFQTVGVVLAVDMPVANADHPVVVAGIPACVDPPCVGRKSLLQVSVDGRNLVLLGRAGKFALAVDHPGVHEQLGRERTAILFTGKHVCKVIRTPEVTAAVVAALENLHGDARGTHAFTGLEVSVKSTLTCGHMHTAWCHGEICDPAAAPANGKVNAPCRGQQSHVGESTVAGGAVTHGRDTKRRVGDLVGLPIIAISAAGVAVAVVKRGGRGRKIGAEAPIRNGGGIAVRHVFDAHDPLADCKIRIGIVVSGQKQTAGCCGGDAMARDTRINALTLHLRAECVGKALIARAVQGIGEGNPCGNVVVLQVTQQSHILLRVLHIRLL